MLAAGWLLHTTSQAGAMTAPPVQTLGAATPPWLDRVNFFRAQANLPPVGNNPQFTQGCWNHARYMAETFVVAHGEDPSSPWYTASGDACARSANLTMVFNQGATAPINQLMAVPFHAVGIIDPHLLKAAYGFYRDTNSDWAPPGIVPAGAALDVIRGRGSIPASVQFPIAWPADGKRTTLRYYAGYEWPDPLTSCPGYRGGGLPIILQLGPGNLTPRVTDSSFVRWPFELQHCIITDTTYVNPDPGAQALGRNTLAARDAVVLIPRRGLQFGATYDVSITANGETYEWSFSVVNPLAP